MPIARNAILAPPRPAMFVDPAALDGLDRDLNGRGAYAAILTTGGHAADRQADTLGKAIARANLKSVVARSDPGMVLPASGWPPCPVCGGPNKRSKTGPCGTCYASQSRHLDPAVAEAHRARVAAYQRANPAKRRGWVRAYLERAKRNRDAEPEPGSDQGPDTPA